MLPDEATRIRVETTRNAVTDLRKRLLDLSNRNRLLNYRHRDTARQFRIIDSSLTSIATALGVGNPIRISGLPKDDESEPAEFEDALARARLTDDEYLAAVANADPDADATIDAAESRLWRTVRESLGLSPDEGVKRSPQQVAQSLGMSTDYELPVEARENANFQTLLFEDALERKLSSIRDESLSSIQERGVNTLYCAVGFLEWFESDDSNKVIHSPLLLFPIELSRGVQHGKYAYTVKGIGEDPETNVTLAERLYADFHLTLPSFDPEGTIAEFLRQLELVIASRKRWRIRTFATVGLFDFTRLAMYKDLDSARRASDKALENHPLLLDLLGGIAEAQASSGQSIFSDDVHHPSAPLLITDADSSQFAAILEALGGRSFVIEGPPGTGKSQTITNLIAASLAAGKRVLFVADKLAALQVVKNRLDAAGLGDFCLELHSTKSRKADVYASIRKRLNLVGSRVYHFEGILEAIRRHKEKLEDYCDSVHAVVGSLGLSVHDLIWREQALRLQLDEVREQLQATAVPNPTAITRRQLLDFSALLSNASERRRSYDEAYGSVRLHPLAAISATTLGQEEIAPLQEAFKELAAIAARVPRLLIEMEVLTEEALSFDLFSNVVDALLRVAQLKPSASASDVTAASLLTDLGGLLRIGGHLLDDIAKRGLWPARLYDAVLRDQSLLAELVQNLDDSRLSCRADLDSSIESARTRTRALASANIALNSIAALLPWTLARTRPSIDALVGVVAVLGSSSRQALLEYDGKLLRIPLPSETLEVSARAESIALKLAQRRAVFDLTLIENTDDLRRKAGVLREAGFLSALFSSEVREAKRFYRRLSVAQESLTRSACASRLVDLAEVIEEKRRFEDDDRLRSDFGNAFRGLETDFSFLASVSQTAAAIREELGRHGEAGAALEAQLAVLDPDTLASLRTSASSDGFAALAAFCSKVPASSSLTDQIAIAEQQGAAAERARELWEGLELPGDFTADELRKLAEQVAIAKEHREALRSNGEAASYFVQPDARDRVAAQVSALRYCQIMRDASVEELIANANPQVLVNSSEAREVCAAKERLLELVDRLVKIASVDINALVHGSLGETSLEALTQSAQGVLSHLSDIPDWLQYRRTIKSIDERGLGDILEICLAANADPAQAFEYVLVRSLILQAFGAKDGLADVLGKDLTAARSGFQEADVQLLRINQARLKDDLLRRYVDVGNRTGNRGSWTGQALIENEAVKSRKHISLRDLFKRSGKALQQLKPCFMMSPLSVAQFIEPGSVHFDLLLIDEASQMRPEDALGSVSRADQFVVVGDPKQLPPTTFFDRAEQSDDVADEDAIETESILDLAMQQYGRPRRLLWHYRSRHDSLIAFSNKHFYDGELQVFPSPDQSGELGVRYKLVGGKYHGGVNPVEAARIAERAIEIMRREPEKSLGIVSMNQAQRDLIRLEFDRRSLLDDDAQKYVESWEDRLEPFIIKNLESIQGDERDVILISTVYGPDDGGQVFQRFGPINSRNGWRRLNVLYTRAKLRVEVISSLRPADIIVDEKTGRGARAFRDYLDYVSSGRLEAGIVSNRPPDSDFEVAVSELLKRSGYECVPQVGVAGFFIDIGVIDPNNVGRFILGIECDGSVYHSTKAARDRDRLKDEVLRRLGWNLHRIWSTDWFADPAREAERAIRMIERLRTHETSEDHNVTSVVPGAGLSGPEIAVRVEKPVVADTRTEPAKVTEVLLESDILSAIRSILPSGAALEREKLLRSIAIALKQPLTRKLRSSVNTMISREVRSGRLQVDASWSVVRRP